jgi:hypothetical protein
MANSETLMPDNYKPDHDQIFCMTLFDNSIDAAPLTAYEAD